MKKFFTMALALMMSVGAMAQDEKHEISVGVGYATYPQFADGLGDALTSFTDDKETKGFGGAYFVSYGYHVTPKFVVGGEVSANFLKKDIIDRDTRKKNADEYDNYYSIMPGVKMNWVNKEHFAFYSRANIGVLIYTLKSTPLDKSLKESTDSGVTVAFHVAPVGFEFGGKFRGFCEVGFGVDGIVNAGLRYKF